jgi:hypothetical protein
LGQLFKVDGFSTSQVSNVTLQVDRRDNPSNPNFQCPVMVQCDAPVFCLYCAGAGTATINGDCSCCTAATPASWSKVKALYGHD